MLANKNTIEKHHFWALPESEVVVILETHTQNGLSSKEAERRLEIFGPNIIEKPRRSPGFSIFLNQFKSPLIIILILAAGATLFIAHYRDAFFILSAVIVNTILGFYQEYKAEKALAELKTYLKQRTRVIRDGAEYEIDAANLVPGDIVRLMQGDRVPADGRFVFTNDFQIDEAILTGESLPVVKSAAVVKEDAGLGDQRSMAFAGTLVTQGVGTIVICRTDFSTELGKIATLVAAESQREKTPLQIAIRRFSLRMGIAIGIITFIIFAISISLGHSLIEMFLISVAIAVSAVPEGLPIAMTVILAIGVERMAKRKGVIRKLIAAETLGSTTVILTDKTGTLTMAKMELGKIVPAPGIDEKELLELALINTNVLIENKNDPISEWRMTGRVLETAL
ncbi:MAG: HAD-IC family P-type ATPase, partial [Candidatus Liptonbacteria bacterium]|nr:HAD-IC family P-type ATPase [Candidatus Liptonbacteria bacterium]